MKDKIRGKHKGRNMISIIVPCYNGEEYLLPCLESIQGQTYQDWEVIFVDDGSGDRSGQIAKDFQQGLDDPKKMAILSHENRGLPATRNRGVRHAKGDYVFFLDCDDWLEPEALEHLVQAINRQADIDVAWMGFDSHYQKSGRVRSYRYPYLLKDRVKTGKAFFLDYLRNKYMIAMGNALYRKSFLDDKAIHFDESLLRGEDIDFEINVFLHCRKVASTAYSGFNYRLHGSSMVHQDREKVINEFRPQLKGVGERNKKIRQVHSPKAALLHEIIFTNVFVQVLGLKAPYRRWTILPAFFYWLSHPILYRQTFRYNLILFARSWQV
jgi:glycosyltransferase involved in cell wall biosynthesis